MIKNTTVYSLLLLGLVSACSNHELDNSTLLGCWMSVEENKMECWEERGDTLVGQGLALQVNSDGQTDTTVWETFKLYTSQDVRQYEVCVEGQEAVVFSEMEPWTFVNPHHDFPKRIQYTLNKSGVLEIIVGEGESAFAWAFQKQ